MNQMASLGQAEAQKAILAIQTEMSKRGKTVVIAVVDPHGELIALLRMDGAPLPAITIAANKAFTAARKQEPTRDIGQRARDPQIGFDMAFNGDIRYVGWGGGVPVRVDGQIVGAVAVSGLAESEDMEAAAIGVKAITG
jgi:glc operon protein GlcG